MPVINVTEMWSPIEYGISLDGRTARRSFEVLLDGADSPASGGLIACTASFATLHIPQTASGHPTNSWLKCLGPKALQTGLNFWQVDCSYAVGIYGDDASILDPLSQPDRLSYGVAATTVQIDQSKDAVPKAIVNVNNELYDPPITDEEYELVETITRNVSVAGFDPTNISTYTDTVNQGNHHSFGAEKCLMTGIRAEPVSFGDPATGYFYQVTFEIHVRKDGWKRRILERGYYGRASFATSPLMRMTERSSGGIYKGQKFYCVPQPLSASGVELRTSTASGTPYFRLWNVKEIKSWAGLGL